MLIIIIVVFIQRTIKYINFNYVGITIFLVELASIIVISKFAHNLQISKETTKRTAQ